MFIIDAYHRENTNHVKSEEVMMRYQVIKSMDIESFVTECNTLAEQGYQPLGGMLVHQRQGMRPEYYQAWFLPTAQQSQ